MRTFEQYIKESVDFRLGGKSSKGDSIKSFSELKNGDVFYYYRVRKDGSEFTIDHYSKRIFLDAYETGKKTEIEYRIVFKDNSKLTSVCDAPNIYKDEDCYIFINVNLGEAVLSINSTRELSEDEIAYLYNDNQEKAHSFKEDSIIICESVDFRLGGKANKSGYRTFEELKPDDVIYEYTVDPEKDYVKLSKYKANSEEGLFLKRKKRENNLIADSSAFVAIGNKWFHTILYSTYELSREEAIEKTAEAMKNSKEWEYVKVEESVDFRLGGKQQKGFDQKKTFADLEEGDTLYLGYVYLDKAKVERRTFIRMYEKSVGTTKIHSLVYRDSSRNAMTSETPVPKDKIVYSYQTGPRVHTNVIASDKTAFIKTMKELAAGKNIQIKGLEELEDSDN